MKKIRAQVAHRTPGRVRLQLPEHRGDRGLFAQLAETLEQSELFRSVRANAVTGSLVLEYDTAPEEVLAQALAQLPFELELTASPAATGAQAPSVGLPAIPLRLVSGRDVSPMLMAGTLFSAVAMHQLLRGKIMVPALTAFWYAMNAFRLAQSETPAQPDEVASRT